MKTRYYTLFNFKNCSFEGGDWENKIFRTEKAAKSYIKKWPSLRRDFTVVKFDIEKC